MLSAAVIRVTHFLIKNPSSEKKRAKHSELVIGAVYNWTLSFEELVAKGMQGKRLNTWNSSKLLFTVGHSMNPAELQGKNCNWRLRYFAALPPPCTTSPHHISGVGWHVIGVVASQWGVACSVGGGISLVV